MIKSILLFIAGSGVVFLGGRELVHHFSSDETKILRALDTCVEAFNDTDNGDVMEQLDSSWTAERGRIDRNSLRRGLTSVFLRQDFREDGAFAFRLRRETEDPHIEITDESAVVTCDFAFDRMVQGDWEQVWVIRTETTWDKATGDWLMTEASHEVISGRRPF